MSLLFAFPHLTNDIIPKSPDWKTGNEPKWVSYAQTQQRISCQTDTIFRLASEPHVTCPEKLGQSSRITTCYCHHCHCTHLRLHTLTIFSATGKSKPLYYITFTLYYSISYYSRSFKVYSSFSLPRSNLPHALASTKIKCL